MIVEMWWTHGKLVHLLERLNTLDLARKTVLCSCSKTLAVPFHTQVFKSVLQIECWGMTMQ